MFARMETFVVDIRLPKIGSVPQKSVNQLERKMQMNTMANKALRQLRLLVVFTCAIIKAKHGRTAAHKKLAQPTMESKIYSAVMGCEASTRAMEMARRTQATASLKAAALNANFPTGWLINLDSLRIRASTGKAYFWKV